EKERQRLESLRRKQEAEEQRKKKVEEEKRRRQAEMKQKREERLKKALQARERVEQMEEEKKKRMERKILQNDEKVCLSQVREEKVAEERSKRRLLKKHEEADARKQKALRMGYKGFFLLQEEDEFEQQEPLQRGREDEVKEKGKKVLELKNLVEQQQVEQVKESCMGGTRRKTAFYPGKDVGNGRRMAAHREAAAEPAAAEPAAPGAAPWQPCGGCSPAALQQPAWTGAAGTRGLEGCGKSCSESRADPSTASAGGLSSWGWLAALPAQLLCSLKGAKDPRPPKANENNYGMDLNSDDSTDDENEPRKPVPAWADGSQLNQAVLHQYYHPVNADQLFGLIPSPRLEDIFGKSKPRYFKRTSSAVWHSPP
ncbi:INCE protein, partial [Ardeotis kori]|nr:INCE protein [Ardeotis kori]